MFNATDVDNDLLVQSRFKNLRLWEAMGGKSALECSANCGVSYQTFISLLNLRISPFNGRVKSEIRKFTDSAKKIASYYNMLVEDLFPLSLYSLNLPNIVERQYSSPELLPLLAASKEPSLLPTPYATVESMELQSAISELLKTLKPREASILKRRFGLGGYRHHTLDEVAIVFGVCKERIRYIELGALTKLRHVSRSQHLLGFLDREERESHHSLIAK